MIFVNTLQSEGFRVQAIFKLLFSIFHLPSSVLHPRYSKVILPACITACLLLLTGCWYDMREQSKVEPLDQSDFFLDGQASRPLLPETVARGELDLDRALYEGRNEDDTPVDAFPIEITREVLDRGHERYDIFCSPCHARLGDGQGMIVQRGFKTPPSFHIDRLREAPPGYYYDVITHGFGAMYSYASRVPPEDRWAIIAYIKALQLSQNATLDDVPPDQRNKLEEPGQ
jgi:mono/diheme cytochrome c family protein